LVEAEFQLRRRTRRRSVATYGSGNRTWSRGSGICERGPVVRERRNTGASPSAPQHLAAPSGTGTRRPLPLRRRLPAPAGPRQTCPRRKPRPHRERPAATRNRRGPPPTPTVRHPRHLSGVPQYPCLPPASVRYPPYSVERRRPLPKAERRTTGSRLRLLRSCPLLHPASA